MGHTQLKPISIKCHSYTVKIIRMIGIRIDQNILRLVCPKSMIIDLIISKTKQYSHLGISVDSSFGSSVVDSDGFGKALVEYSFVVMCETQGREFDPVDCFRIVFSCGYFSNSSIDTSRSLTVKERRRTGN